MLLEFTAQNFRSIRAPLILSMLSTRVRELRDHKIPFSGKKYGNKLAVLFGSNASGKSNVLLAFMTMRDMVEKLGVSREANKKFPLFYEPFALSAAASREPTMFQAAFIAHGKYYRHGFKYNGTEVLEEWVMSGKPSSEKPLFSRAGSRIDYLDDAISLDERKMLEKQISPTSLLLSIGADLKVSDFTSAASFYSNFIYFGDMSFPLAFMLEDDELLELLAKMLMFADTGIVGIERREFENKLPNVPANYDEKLAKLLKAIKEYAEAHPHQMFVFKHGNSETKDWWLPEFEESRGTCSFLRLLYVLCRALKNNGVAVIDEIDESLHPLLLARALQFFTSFDKEAQLICTCHAPIIFSTKAVRRDELYIVEKSSAGGTFIKRSSDYKEARNDGNLTLRYLEGRFGGVPLMDNNDMHAILENAKTYINGQELEDTQGRGTDKADGDEKQDENSH